MHPLAKFSCKTEKFTLPDGEVLEFKELTLQEEKEAYEYRRSNGAISDNSFLILASCTSLDVSNPKHQEIVKNLPAKLGRELSDVVLRLIGVDTEKEMEIEKKSSKKT